MEEIRNSQQAHRRPESPEKKKEVKLLHSHLTVKHPMIRSAQSQVYSVFDQHGESLVLKTFPPKEWHQ